jgi:ubiquitin C-terminal hydrolase
MITLIVLIAGHYICDVHKPGTDTWQSCNDSSVTTIAEAQVLNSRQNTAYILLYSRIKDGR